MLPLVLRRREVDLVAIVERRASRPARTGEPPLKLVERGLDHGVRAGAVARDREQPVVAVRC